jgi:hypothetical protein
MEAQERNTKGESRVRPALVAALLMSANAMAEYVTLTVPNGSFELPGTTKQIGWDGEWPGMVDVPGWSSDTVAVDSGVEVGRRATDGQWTAFLMGDLQWKSGQRGDPAIWNLLPYVVQAGDEFMLSLDAWSIWQTTELTMTLYYHEIGGERIPVATQSVGLTDSVQTFRLRLAADDVPEAIGHKLGIEINNPGAGYAGIDNVRIPEPTTILLLGVGGWLLLRRRETETSRGDARRHSGLRCCHHSVGKG